MNSKFVFAGLVLLLSTVTIATANAHDEPDGSPSITYKELFDSRGIDLSKAEVTTEKLRDGLYILFGQGGNIVASTGEDGLLIVDDQFPEMMPNIKAALRKLSAKDVDMVINTHWHFDHANGNLALGKEGAQIVSQKNSRAMMAKDKTINASLYQLNQPAYPPEALPDITFEREMSIYFNGEEITLFHFGAAHTAGDAVVFFRERNAIHMGDVYNNSGFPFIDADNGGSINGMIAFCEKILAQLDEDTIVVPGHGPVATTATLSRYIEILKTTRDAINTMVANGKSLTEVLAAKPTANFDKELGADENSARRYVDRVYKSLKQ